MVIDWTKANKTKAAGNVKPEDVPLLQKMVSVPRTVFDRYWPRPWSEVEAAAFAGTDGLSPWLTWRMDRATTDEAYLHEHAGRPGVCCLYSQGW